ncbi:MAG TPA: hypothetical protein VK851_06460 [Anaerolineales bacterium]|nr:hypothetical protein [Anaerolineales bacterium]
MNLPWLWIVVAILVITSIGVMLSRDWRWLIILLALQYAGVLLLALQHWPVGMATVKVIAGWMSAAILGMTHSNFLEEQDNTPDVLPQGRLFRFIAAIVVGLIVASSVPLVDVMMADAGRAVSAGGLLLIGMGLLHLGVTDRILQVTIGLMTVLAGFEVLYAAVESSTLVAALLAVINLGLALTGSYLMVAENADEAEEAESTI